MNLVSLGISVSIVAVVLGVVLPGIGWLYGTFVYDWGVSSTLHPTIKKIAFVHGDLGGGFAYQSAWGGFSTTKFLIDLRAAGYTVEEHHNPNEAALATIMTNNDMVIAMGHGINDHYDENGKPISGITLGGTSTHADEDEANPSLPMFQGPDLGSTIAIPPEIITANELAGQVANPDLVFVIPGCRGTRTNAFSLAVQPELLVGSAHDTTDSGATAAYEWVVDHLNAGGDANAEQDAKDAYFAKSQFGYYRINPDNADFENPNQNQ